MNRSVRALTLATVTLATILGWMLVAAPQEARSGHSGPLDPKPRIPLMTTIATTQPQTPAEKAAASPAAPPITFADPDGQQLEFEELSARTVVHEMLSLTELELHFRNPQAKQMEGRFSFALPPGAAISRFAYEINGRLMEGEVVERLRANQVYEQFLHQMRDPALLEQDLGNRFSARIFPIAPHAPVRLLLSYTMLLPAKNGVRTYTLPLRGLQEVKKLTFRAFATPLPLQADATGGLTTSAAEVTSFDRTDWTPDRDIVLTWNSKLTGPSVLRAGDYVLAALQPRVASHRIATASGRWLFYVDSSASAAEGAEHRIRALESLLGALPAADRVEIVTFDNELIPLRAGAAGDVARRIGGQLRNHLFIGGTDLEAVVRDIARRARDGEKASVVVASDLVPTLGRTESHELQTAISALPEGVRVDALILGNREHAPLARALTRGRGRVLRVPFTESLARHAAETAAELRRPVGGTVEVSDPSAEWIYPTRFDDVQPGDEVLALGRLRAGAEPAIAGAKSIRLDATTFAPLLEREAHRAHLDYLAEREAGETSESVRRALAAEQVRISVERRVVIPRTTMLVLETEWDYQRFGLDRRALADILTIEAGGIGRIDRRAPEWRRVDTPPIVQRPMPTPPPPPARPVPVMKDSAAREEAVMAVPQQAAPPSAVSESITVEGAVLGGVAGEVAADSVASSAVRAERAPGFAAEERRSRRQVSNEQEPHDWTKVVRPTREQVEALTKRLREDPQDREAYNLLGEALAARGEWRELRELAISWQPYDPENPQVYELLGIAASERGDRAEAARAFASLIEIGPAKPELLQRAGLLLLRAGKGAIAETPLRRALELRPDRANGYRHLALILRQEGRIEEAARTLESATAQSFPGWYGQVQRVIHEELGYVYRAWLQKAPERRAQIEARAREYGVDLERTDAMRITLVWETDANDVDLHVVDPRGEQCFYGHPSTKSGLTLYEDITQGLGPEVMRTSELDRGTYHVGVRYFAAGPMGISRGVVVVMREGNVELHPFRLTTQGGPVRYVTGVTIK